jgi:hypothetical protein
VAKHKRNAPPPDPKKASVDGGVILLNVNNFDKMIKRGSWFVSLYVQHLHALSHTLTLTDKAYDRECASRIDCITVCLVVLLLGAAFVSRCIPIGKA